MISKILLCRTVFPIGKFGISVIPTTIKHHIRPTVENMVSALANMLFNSLLPTVLHCTSTHLFQFTVDLTYTSLVERPLALSLALVISPSIIYGA